MVHEGIRHTQPEINSYITKNFNHIQITDNTDKKWYIDNAACIPPNRTWWGTNCQANCPGNKPQHKSHAKQRNNIKQPKPTTSPNTTHSSPKAHQNTSQASTQRQSMQSASKHIMHVIGKGGKNEHKTDTEKYPDSHNNMANWQHHKYHNHSRPNKNHWVPTLDGRCGPNP